MDPVHGSVPTILDFLQSLLERGLSHSTLKVYVVAIISQHIRVDNGTVGSHRLLSLFLKGAQMLHPPQPKRTPAWDLPLVPAAEGTIPGNDAARWTSHSAYAYGPVRIFQSRLQATQGALRVWRVQNLEA